VRHRLLMILALSLTQLYGVRVGFVSCGLLALLLVIPLTRMRAMRAD
jgi:hypothetical protein